MYNVALAHTFKSLDDPQSSVKFHNLINLLGTNAVALGASYDMQCLR